MGRVIVYIVLFGLLGSIAFSTEIIPDWLVTIFGFYLTATLVFLGFAIGYELGLRARNNRESIFDVRSWQTNYRLPLLSDNDDSDRSLTSKAHLDCQDEDVAERLKHSRRSTK